MDVAAFLDPKPQALPNQSILKYTKSENFKFKLDKNQALVT